MENWIWVSVLALIALITLLIELRRRSRSGSHPARDISGFFRYHKSTTFERKKAFAAALAKSKAGKKSKSEERSEKHESSKKERKEDTPVFAVINFEGDLRGKQHKMLAELVDEIEINKDELSGVVVVVQSAGGVVLTYGHAFAEMERIRRLGLELTVCIDVVAASGGYLMSLPANKIVAAPFATVGSIGVLAFVPNVRKLLENHQINPRTFTAGALKRTVSMTDDASEEEVRHFQAQLDTIHDHFLELVKHYRPQVSIELVQTGEHWSAHESIERGLNLVDQIGTSNELLLSLNRDNDLLLLSQKKNVFDDKFSWLTSRLGI